MAFLFMEQKLYLDKWFFNYSLRKQFSVIGADKETQKKLMTLRNWNKCIKWNRKQRNNFRNWWCNHYHDHFGIEYQKCLDTFYNEYEKEYGFVLLEDKTQPLKG